MTNFSNFRTLDPEIAEIARELLHNADRQQSACMSFINTWMAFNGWMESVTQADTDAQMITKLATNERMIESYDTLIGQSAEFRDHVCSFAAMWPILNVRDVRKKLGHDVFRKMSREELLTECVRHRVKVQPMDWENDLPPSWEQLLRTTYLTRCNFFHGVKSPQNPRDRELIYHANSILRMFIQDTALFEWYD